MSCCTCGGMHPSNMPCLFHLQETEKRFQESRGGLAKDPFKPIEPIKPITPIFPEEKNPFGL